MIPPSPPAPSYRATFTSEARNVALARNAIASFARLCGFSDDDTADIRLAAGEALSNASEYGSAMHGGGFSVSCTFDEPELRIEIQDSGKGFITPPASSSIAPDERDRGFGIFIMRRLMDSVTFARNGTRIKLVRALSSDRTPGAERHPHDGPG